MPVPAPVTTVLSRQAVACPFPLCLCWFIVTRERTGIKGLTDNTGKPIMAALHCEPFGRVPDGRETSCTLWKTTNCGSASPTSAAAWSALRPPTERVSAITSCWASTASMATSPPALLYLLGRYANRIANGSFTLDGQTYTLSRNEGENTLHGGAEGFSKRLWGLATATAHPIPTLALNIVSPDGDQGFPGEPYLAGNLSTQRGYLVARVRSADDKADDREPECAPLFQSGRSRLR